MANTIEQLEKENRVLKTRCYVLSNGQLCYFCPLKCEHRKEPFREEVAADDSGPDKRDS